MKYKFKSLGAQTNLLMDQFLACPRELEDYIVIRTPERPNYFWGNYLFMKKAPKRGDFQQWIEIFEREIGKKEELGYCAITFDYDVGEEFDSSEFSQNGFCVDYSKILVADELTKTAKVNRNFVVKEYDLEANIESYVDVHYDEKWEYGTKEEQLNFLKEQALEFTSLINRAVAKRFGAFLEDRLVADLGVYWNESLIRFNSVSTHRNFRRQGACSTLVYEVSKKLLEEYPSKKLVMQADEDYHAAAIYESVGFIAQERLISFEWKDDSKFGNN